MICIFKFTVARISQHMIFLVVLCEVEAAFTLQNNFQHVKARLSLQKNNATAQRNVPLCATHYGQQLRKLLLQGSNTI